MLNDDDPRLQIARQHDLPASTVFQRKLYHAYRPDWQHDHCVGCWATLAEYEGAGYLKEGFAVTADYPKGENYEWVCPNCFEALKSQMGWLCVT
jgi:hypothetical protein